MRNKNHISNNDKDVLNEMPNYKTSSKIGKNIEDKILQSGDISIMNMDKINFEAYSKLILTNKLNQNNNENVNTYKN